MSPCLIKCLDANGLHPVDYQADSLADAVKHEPENGIYTVTNTFETFKTLKLDAHLDRLEDSARRAGIANFTLDRDRLRSALRTMIAEADFGSVRFRVTVPQAIPDKFILTIEPFTPLSEAFIMQGVRCITAPDSARHNAAAKTTDWMHTRKALSDAMPAGIYDTILLDAQGNMLEGLGANFYAIKDDTLYTAGNGVLGGIAQQIVYEVAPHILPIVKTPLNRDDIRHIDEAFITSSSRGIVPVIAIDGHNIGSGSVGDKTLTLRDAYNRWVNTHLATL